MNLEDVQGTPNFHELEKSRNLKVRAEKKELPRKVKCHKEFFVINIR
jgi:hypothetical protein